MAKTSVERRGVSIALACRAFGVSETCYRYSPKLRDENEEIADLLTGLTDARKTWGFGLCFLNLHVMRSTQRDEIIRKLTQASIGAQIHHPIVPHMQGAHKSFGYAAQAFPLASQLAHKVFSLPIGPHIDATETADPVRYVMLDMEVMRKDR